jgi:hypothetical protein
MSAEEAIDPKQSRSRLGLGPGAFSTLAIGISLVAVSSGLQGSGWIAGFVRLVTIVAALSQLNLFVRQGREQGFSRKRMLFVGYAAYFLTIGVVIAWPMVFRVRVG